MLGSLLKAGLRRFGYDLTLYPLPDWEIRPASLRNGLKEIFTALRINCVIDVGANEGQYGAMLRENGYKGRIVSFEPVNSTFERLKDRSGNDPDWHVYRMALGSRNEMLEMMVMGGDQFSSLLPMNSFGRDKFQDQAVVARTEMVSVERLDSKIEDLVAGIEEPRIYLKMDTQGYDLEVLEGASGCLSRLLALQSEIALRPIYEGMPNYLTALEKFNNLGFRITSLTPVSRDTDMSVIEFDCLMVRSSLTAAPAAG